jgi:hypothetical protein
MLAEMIPLPSEETTPPVTKMYFLSIKPIHFMDCKGSCILAARIFSFQLFIYFFAQTDNLKAKTGCLLSDCFKKSISLRRDGVRWQIPG